MPLPDADLHPVATGLAKETVDAHAAEQQLKLYAGWFCPFVQRAWLALEEKKIPYQYIEINPYHKAPEFLASNPRGLVPTLEVAPKKCLYESSVLLDYIESAYPSHSPSLLPSDHFQRARAKIWMDFVSTRIIPAFHRFLQFQAQNYDDGEERLKGLRDEYRRTLLEFTREMAPSSGGPWFLGAEISQVDIMLAPWGVRNWIFEHFKGLPVEPQPGQAGDDEDVWERWRTWMRAVEGRESVKRTTSEREHFLPIYQRYADDVAQSELAKATREGRGVP